MKASTRSAIHRVLGATYLILGVSAQGAAPVIHNPAITTATVGSPYRYDLGATDADGDTLHYWLSVWPHHPAITISPQGVIAWHPQHHRDGGRYHITAYVEDGKSSRESIRYTLSVTDPDNHKPVIHNPAITTATVGAPYRYDLGATDADGDTLHYWLSVWPRNPAITISPQGIIEWQPQPHHQAKTYTITAYVDDNTLGRQTIQYPLTVGAPIDTDGDGSADPDDAFPHDPLESRDANNDLIGDNTPQHQLTQYTYNDVGLILTVDGPRTDVNDITTYRYTEPRYYRTRITDAVGNVTTLGNHNSRGQPQQMTDANGTLTTRRYDSRGRLLSNTIAHPSGDPALASTTRITYDKVGNITQVTAAVGVFNGLCDGVAGLIQGIVDTFPEGVADGN